MSGFLNTPEAEEAEARVADLEAKAARLEEAYTKSNQQLNLLTDRTFEVADKTLDETLQYLKGQGHQPAHIEKANKERIAAINQKHSNQNTLGSTGHQNELQKAYSEMEELRLARRSGNISEYGQMSYTAAQAGDTYARAQGRNINDVMSGMQNRVSPASTEGYSSSYLKELSNNPLVRKAKDWGMEKGKEYLSNLWKSNYTPAASGSGLKTIGQSLFKGVKNTLGSIFS